MKKLLLCLCLALFVGSMVLPADVFGYVAPDQYGVRVGTGIPASLLPGSLPSCLSASCLYKNLYVDQICRAPYDAGSCYTSEPVTECMPDWGWWAYLIPLHSWDDWNRCCNYRRYRFDRTSDPCNYNPNTYDYDGDGTPDIADANPDTPPSQVAKGGPLIPTPHLKTTRR